MKSKLKIIIPLLVILVIMFAPAKLITLLIPNNSDVNVEGVSGTVWNLNISKFNVKGWSFQDVKFDTNSMSLLTGKIGGDVDILKGDLQGTFFFSTKDKANLELKQANVTTALSKFEKYIPFKGIELNGTMNTDAFNLLLTDSKPKLISGTTKWLNGGVAFNGKAWQLGDFSILWQTTKDGTIQGKIQKSKNKIDILGDINISKNGLLEFKGSISTRVDKAIYNAFLFFKDGDVKNGRQAIKFKKKIW